jgi:beta-galactosidase
MRLNLSILFVSCLLSIKVFAQGDVRKDIALNSNWLTIADQKSSNTFNGFQTASFNDSKWKKVNVPHNWDQYEGYQRKLHGNKHGYAWYRKTFKINENNLKKKFFLYFEGVGSYATIWLNGKKVGTHAGGRTTFTIEVTSSIKLNNQANLLAVRADHPAQIKDLPWVDGGCATERGFSEGSQPMGIFRPVHLIITNEVRIEPFGVHIWNDNNISEKLAVLDLNTTVGNYSQLPQNITVINQLIAKNGQIIKSLNTVVKVLPNAKLTVKQNTGEILDPKLWSLTDPYLYNVKTTIIANGKTIDELNTPYGIRWISWPPDSYRDGEATSKQFLLNGKPVFINGVAEYEHLIGQSHAFSDEQIKSRVMQIKAAGFNAFRDAHQPHNLLYQTYWDKLGILSWTQMAAHIWYDTPEFRRNFKLLLTDWVIERRNSPSVVLWGLENESTLPEDFAKECTELIRSLDPTTSSQRKVTTCNGGKGTDWDVPQNWTGTYGGNPQTYAEDLKKQVLVGEYGAWRTLDLHAVDSLSKGYTENQMTTLMETKVRLAESVKDQVAGHFFWLFNSHDNPGRVQGGEGLRDIDRVGPVNYKGMFTPWEEPTDVFYMFRSNYAPKRTEPMVYIVSHTWPNRFVKSGIKDSIVLYSNCDEVELFNDINALSLGKRKHGGVGTHFQWNDVNIQYNVLYAVGYVDGKAVAKDYIVLQNLPNAPHFNDLIQDQQITTPEKGYHYLYRLNCGGPDYTDKNGMKWWADRQISDKQNFGSSSWAVNFTGIPSFFASQRRTFDPITGTLDWRLFQTFRYGREQLSYHFPVPDGDYLVELYFIEPWLGTGGGFDATGMRLFDVAINNKTVLQSLDIWKEVGHDAALKKTIKATVSGGQLVISFPQVKSGQALISAIAIASLKQNIKPAQQSKSLIADRKTLKIVDWMDIGEMQYQNEQISFVQLPSNLYGAEWLQLDRTMKGPITFNITAKADVFVAIPENAPKVAWLEGFEDTKSMILNSEGVRFKVYRQRFTPREIIDLGDDGNQIYTVAVLPPSQMEPAYDLKSTSIYKATEATLIGKSLVKEELMGKQRVTFKAPNKDVLTFNISFGVADTYSLTLKYHNPTTIDLKAKLEFTTTDGTIMKSEEIVLNPTKAGKWNYLTTNTGSMINAGSYKVNIIAIDSKDLTVDELAVQ